MKLARKLVARAWSLAADARNRRFATRLSCRPDAPALLLSPHLDDAVLDCWWLLSADCELSVINVFTGMPPAGSSRYWDRIAGFDDSQGLLCARIAEDREALALAGRSPVNLPFREGQYRVARRPPVFCELDAAITKHIPAYSIVYAPVNIGVMHSDHRLVREYARALAARAKLAAMRTYRTQFPTLDRGPIGRLSNPRLHSYELFWLLGGLNAATPNSPHS